MNIFLKLMTVFLFCFSCLAVVDLQGGKTKLLKKQYAIYLTTGSEAHQESAEWGGFHITLTGFHEKNDEEAFISKIPQIIKDTCTAQKRWRLKNPIIKKWSGQWTLVFHSETLDEIVRQLAQEGFQKVKGPEFCNSPFHMVLRNVQERQDAEALAQDLKHKEWFITYVEMTDSKHSFLGVSWLHYLPF